MNIQDAIKAHEDAADLHEQAQHDPNVAPKAMEATTKATKLTLAHGGRVTQQTEIAFLTSWNAVENEETEDRASEHGQACHAHEEVAFELGKETDVK